MEQTRIFKSNRSQAVRLPKAVAFPDEVKDVNVIAEGRVRIVVPSDVSWDAWFDGPAASEDFMIEREQPPEQEREGF